MNNYMTILPEGCSRFGHSVKRFCLPKKVDCNKTITDGLLSDCDNIWGCGLCQSDQEYYIPILEDEKIMIQSNFNNQSGAWGTWIDIYYVSTSGNETIVPEAAKIRKIIATSKKHAYQTIEIAVSEIPLTCFQFKIKSTGNDDVCTQYFKKESCFNLVSFEGIYKDYDCWNNYYGNPYGDYTGDLFIYSNKIWLKGSLKVYNIGVDEEIIRFTPSELVPPFMMKYISHKIMGAKTVNVDGESMIPVENVISAREKSNMFWPILEFTKNVCAGSGAKCT